MRFTVKDLLIFVVLVTVAYFALYGENAKETDSKGFFTFNKVKKAATIVPKVNRPSVDDVPVYYSKYFANNIAMGGNTIPSPHASRVIRVSNSDNIIFQRKQNKEELDMKKKSLRAALSSGEIDKRTYDSQMRALYVDKKSFEPQYREITVEEYAREQMEKRLGVTRYGEYIKECVQAELKRVSKNLNSKILVKVKYNGDLIETQVLSSNSAKSNKKLAISSVDKLLVALEKAAPFQPFPSAVRAYDLSYELTLENGELTVSKYYGTIRPFCVYSPSNKPRNKKRVENTKIVEANVVALGCDEGGRILYASNILRGNQIYWKPVKAYNNAVSVSVEYKDGKLVNPIFMRKSDISEANEAALDAMYSLLLPDLSAFEQYPVIKLQGSFSVK